MRLSRQSRTIFPKWFPKDWINREKRFKNLWTLWQKYFQQNSLNSKRQRKKWSSTFSEGYSTLRTNRIRWQNLIGSWLKKSIKRILQHLSRWIWNLFKNNFKIQFSLSSSHFSWKISNQTSRKKTRTGLIIWTSSLHRRSSLKTWANWDHIKSSPGTEESSETSKNFFGI